MKWWGNVVILVRLAMDSIGFVHSDKGLEKPFKGHLKDIERPLRALEGPSGTYRALKGLITPSRALQSLQGPYTALKGLIKPSRTL